MNMRIEKWCGYNIRFVEINGHWWAILKDICDALGLKTFDVSRRLSPDMLEKIRVSTCDMGLTEVTYRARKTQEMLAINEKGIYLMLFASRKLEARKFQFWVFDIMEKLRQKAGLEEYEALRMTDLDIQEEIDWMIDSLYWDAEKKCVMQSYIVPGGDVEQRRFI